jgi:transcriptional regulator GlxA family with amidase domain
MERRTVGIVIFDDIEVLDFCGPFDVFSTTRLDDTKRQEEPSPFEVKLIAENGGHVCTSGGMRVCADYSFEGSMPSMRRRISSKADPYDFPQVVSSRRFVEIVVIKDAEEQDFG